jgi:hypothetical protein
VLFPCKSLLRSVSSPKRHCHVYPVCGTFHSKNFPTEILMYHNEGDTSRQHSSAVDIQESPLCPNWIFIRPVFKYGSWCIWRRKLAGENPNDAGKTGGPKLSKKHAALDSSGVCLRRQHCKHLDRQCVCGRKRQMAFTFSIRMRSKVKPHVPAFCVMTPHSLSIVYSDYEQIAASIYRKSTTHWVKEQKILKCELVTPDRKLQDSKQIIFCVQKYFGTWYAL